MRQHLNMVKFRKNKLYKLRKQVGAESVRKNKAKMTRHFLIFYHHHLTVGIRPSCTMLSLYYLAPHP
jgi:hypothetical protein